MSFLSQFFSMGMGSSGSSAGSSAGFEDDVTSTATSTLTSTATSTLTSTATSTLTSATSTATSTLIEPITTVISGIGSFFDQFLPARNDVIEKIVSNATATATSTLTTLSTLTTETLTSNNTPLFSASVQEDENSSSSIPLSYILGATSLLALTSIIVFVAVRRKEKKLEEGETYECEPYDNDIYTPNSDFTEVYLEPRIQPVYDISHPSYDLSHPSCENPTYGLSYDNPTYTYQTQPLYDLAGDVTINE